MSNQRTHFVTTSDGVTIGGTVHGRGPAIVFLQGAVGDGDLDWQRVLPYLTDRYTCHLPSMRCRGLSGDHADLRSSRILEDYATYVDSIGEPFGLTGWSGGGYYALSVAASRPGAVAAVAPFEPGFLNLLDEAEHVVAGAAVTRTAEFAAEGKLAAAARAFVRWPFTDEDIAGAEDVGYLDAAARYVPNLLNLLQQAMAAGDGADVLPPAALGTISAPVWVLLGSDTKPFFSTCARHVVAHVPNARIHEIPGAGHAAPLTHPEALAKALAECLAPARQPS